MTAPDNKAFSAHNAGLVILNDYLPMLFDRLGTIANKQFVSPAHQSRCVSYLQYLATGTTATAADPLPVNNILCGLPPGTDVTAVQLTSLEKETMDGLLGAAISHWPSAGGSTINGFRGNWLVRDGIVKEQDDHWLITVEKRAYDVLLNKSPFSFSVIKYPWMEKALVVVWSY